VKIQEIQILILTRNRIFWASKSK